MTTLELDRVVTEPLATALTAAAAVNATTLSVSWNADFTSVPGKLQVNGVTYTYVAKPDDSTLTLQAPGLTAAAAVDDVVQVVGSDGKPKRELKAYMRTLGAVEPVPFRVDSDLEDKVTPATPSGTLLVVDENELRVLGVADSATPADASGYVNVPTPYDSAQTRPDTSPVPATVPMADYALLKLPTFRADTVVDIFVTDNPANAKDATTRVAQNTRQVPYPLRTLADGSALLATQQYYVATLARNSAGDAVGGASAWVPFGLVPLPGEYIQSLAVDKLDSGEMSADVVYSGRGFFGQALELGPAGLVATKTDGSKTIISADPGIANTIAGQLYADAATFTDNVQMRGLNNFLSGRLNLAAGVPNPTAKPTVTFDWATQTVTTSTNSGFFHGLYYAAGVFYSCSDEDFAYSLIAWNASDGSPAAGGFFMPGGFRPVGGPTKLGASWYVLGQDDNRGGDWWVFRFNAAGAKTGEWAVSYGVPNGAAIGNDGTDLLIARVDSGGLLKINVHDAGTGAIGSTIAGPAWSGQITSITKTAVGFSGTRYVASTIGAVRVFSVAGTTATRQTADEWPRAGDLRGLTHDGTNWRSFGGRQIATYTNLVGSHTAYFAWRDDNNAGSGTAETLISDGREVTMARQRMTVSIQTPPWDGTVDGANTGRIYVKIGTGTTVLQTSLAQGTLSATYSTISTTVTPSTPPSTSGFASRSGAVGAIQSSTGKTRIGGDDVTALNGTFTREASGTLTTTSGSTVTWEVWAGTVWITSISTAMFATGNTTITTSQLPAAYRPAANVDWGASLSGATGALRITTAGNVVVINNTGLARTGLNQTVVPYPRP